MRGYCEKKKRLIPLFLDIKKTEFFSSPPYFNFVLINSFSKTFFKRHFFGIYLKVVSKIYFKSSF
jgi:hypothetical protein